MTNIAWKHRTEGASLTYTEEEMREHKMLYPLSPTASLSVCESPSISPSISYMGFSGSAMTYYPDVYPQRHLPATWKCNGCHAGNAWEEGSCTQCGSPKYDSVDYE